MSDETVPFNLPSTAGNELRYVQEAVEAGLTAGGGPFARRCEAWLADAFRCPQALLTHSGTAALELAALLVGLEPGDEVIMPSFTFASTANAFALRGAVPVFVDVREDTLNIDESLIADAVTPRTRVIVPVHYAGVAAEMDPILALARERGLLVVEDGAHCLPSTYRGRPLGVLGDLGVLSFHETKNVSCGEGGALLIGDRSLAARAEILHEKGTDRTRFLRGETDRYEWLELGSSFAPSDLSAAYLWAQLEAVDGITARRQAVWRAYHEAFAQAERDGLIRRPVVPEHCGHNAHLYHLLIVGEPGRDAFIDHLASRGVQSVFHYVPLHSAPAGRRLGRAHGDLAVTDRVSGQLVRLPMWAGMQEHHVERVIGAVHEALDVARSTALGR